MITPQLTIPQWLSFSYQIKQRLIEIFNIPKSSGSLVENNKVISDGHTHNDLLSISVEKMQEYLNSTETDFYALFNAILEKLEKEQKEVEDNDQKLKEEQESLQVEQYQKDVVEAIKNVTEMAQVVVKKRGRPAKES
jgi:hypothetical protein